MKELFFSLEKIVRDAGKIMLRAKRTDMAVREKLGDEANLVTEYDTETQSFLINKITELLPSAAFIAEEKDNDKDAISAEHCFIIDPIDGTANFVHNYSHSAISLAYLKSKEPKFAAVYNPFSGEMFAAAAGYGAYLNGRRISVSDRNMPRAIIAFGSSPYYKDILAEPTFDILKALFFKCSDVRRLGSAALDLAYLAAGRCDGFFEMKLSPWDFAAGLLLVREAGGIVTDTEGNDVSLSAPSPIVAATPKIHTELLSVIQGVN